MTRILYPLSVDLNSKSVLMVGGGRIAARKISELIRCGAAVTVIAPEIVESILRLKTAIRIHLQEFKNEDLEKYYLVFACTNNPAVNETVAKLCHAKNILCNIAHHAESGSFHVPGVLRHGDVTLTVSTGGMAPGLTRHLKRELGVFLGPEIAQLSLLIGKFRDELKSSTRAVEAQDLLESLPYRKLLADLKDKGTVTVEAFLKTIVGKNQSLNVPAPKKMVQTVYIVGAGPGNPKLLTLLAAETIKQAEVIIHDRLIPEETLQLSQTNCLLIPAGKRGHFESSRQSDIEKSLVDHALAGKKVVRLKGGDPFVYGRGWEEVLALEAHAIPWTVIPGLSSTTAGPTWAGIPLTHRGLARSFAVMSGMTTSETNTEIPKADTVVLLMGLQRLAEIIPAFIAQGYRPNTPAAAIQNATMGDQRICRSTLENLLEDTTKLGFDSPTLIVVGEVVNLGAVVSLG